MHEPLSATCENTGSSFANSALSGLSWTLSRKHPNSSQTPISRSTSSSSFLKVLENRFHTIEPSSYFFSGYSIFVVDGNLPQSEADQTISLCPVVPPPHVPPQPKAKPSKIEAKIDKFFSGVSKKLGFGELFKIITSLRWFFTVLSKF